ncbi:MAG: hypothetical protein IPM61_15020 [Chlorobi bacterium]|nr:hypothetical protein [Chlorobiota bacterium]MBX7217832.1 hypothetical protein [Candidatus Kapabacteria bacterium]
MLVEDSWRAMAARSSCQEGGTRLRRAVPHLLLTILDPAISAVVTGGQGMGVAG